MSNSDLSFKDAFPFVHKAMYITGTHPFLPRNRSWLLKFLVLLVINSICLFFLSNSVFGHDAKSGNYMEASKNFAMMLISFSTNIKFYTLIYCRESLASLLGTMDRDYNSAKELNEEETNIILLYSKKAASVGKFWVFILFVAGVTFPGKALILMSYYYSKGEGKLVPIFDLTFPDFIERYKTTLWAYSGVFGLCLMFDFFAFLVFTSFEPLIPIFTLHICGQLKILSLKICKIIPESGNEKEMKEKFARIDMKLKELYSFIGHVQNSFMMIMEFNMKTTTFLIPCNLFLLVQDFRNNNTVNVEFFILTAASFAHFFSPCYFCDLLMDASEMFREAIYSCGWENCRYIRIRKMVYFMLMRASKPFSISSIFFTINLDSFAIMCRQAYALFNLMTAALTDIN